MAKYRVTDNLTGKTFIAEGPDDATPEELQASFEQYLAQQQDQPEEGYFSTLMKKVKEAETVATPPGGVTLGDIMAAPSKAVMPAIEAGLALTAGAAGSAAGSTIGAAGGYLTALSEGLSPGSDAFNRRVFELTQSGAELGGAPFQPTTEAGKQIVGTVQEALAPLPPTLGMGNLPGNMTPDIQTLRNMPAAPSQFDIPPLMDQPSRPQTSKELARLIRGDNYEQLAAAATPSSELAAAQAQLGTQLGPEFITERPQFRELARSLEVGKMGEAVATRKSAIADLKDKIVGLAEKYGGTRNLSEIDVATRNQMNQGVKSLETAARAEYDRLSNLVDRQGRVSADNLIGFLEQQIKDVGGVANLSPAERRLYSRLKPKTVKTKDGIKIIQPTYGLIDRTRRELTASKYENKGVFKDTETGLISKLESELAKDQEAAVGKLGSGQASDVYKAARDLVRTRKGLEENIISLFGKEAAKDTTVGQFTGNLTGAVGAMKSGDFTSIDQLMKAIPANMRQKAMTSAIVEGLAKNPDNLITWYEGVNRNPRARVLLKKYVDPNFLRDLSAGYKLSKSVESFYAQVPKDRLRTVATGADGVIRTFFRSAGPRIAEYITSQQRRQTGIVNTAMSSAVMPKSRKLQLANEFLVSEDFGQLVKSIGTNQQPSAIKRAARSKRFAQFANEIGLPKEINGRELWLLDAIQSEARLQAEEQQQQQQQNIQ